MDSRYALNYLFRKGGTFTVQNIDVTVNKTVSLQGLDANYNDINAASYTVSDYLKIRWKALESLHTNTFFQFPYQWKAKIQSIIS